MAIADATDNVRSPIAAIAATTARPTPIAAYNSFQQNSANNFGRINPNTGRYEQWNPYSARYEQYNPNVYSRYNQNTGRYEQNNFNNYGQYNAKTGRYEQYNPYTGRYDANYYDRYNQNYPYYQRNWNNGYINPYTGQYEYNSRYNPLTGRYESNRYDGNYYQNSEFARRYSPEVYGRGSVNAVHVPLLRYDNEGHWAILRDDRSSNDGDYHYAYETENGIRAAEDSHQENKQTTAETSKKTGFYEYVGDDGKTYRVDWVADENGYRAEVIKKETI